MGCGQQSAEEKMFLTKLERLEIQVRKEKELKKLSDLEGKEIKSLEQFKGIEPKTENSNNMENATKTKSNKTSINENKKKTVKKKVKKV